MANVVQPVRSPGVIGILTVGNEATTHGIHDRLNIVAAEDLAYPPIKAFPLLTVNQTIIPTTVVLALVDVAIKDSFDAGYEDGQGGAFSN
jgi:hypothetical protein